MFFFFSSKNSAVASRSKLFLLILRSAIGVQWVRLPGSYRRRRSISWHLRVLCAIRDVAMWRAVSRGKNDATTTNSDSASLRLIGIRSPSQITFVYVDFWRRRGAIEWRVGRRCDTVSEVDDVRRLLVGIDAAADEKSGAVILETSVRWQSAIPSLTERDTHSRLHDLPNPSTNSHVRRDARNRRPM